MSKVSPQQIRQLEERLVTEVNVATSIYDMDIESYAQWAASHIEPLEYARAHAVGWIQGRARAGACIARMLRELRAATGDDEPAWNERLARLGLTRDRLVSTF